jgi:pyridoxal phosphate enzyme (YggS family)
LAPLPLVPRLLNSTFAAFSPMSTSAMTIAENLRDVRRRIVDACTRTGRSPSDVKLVAVTKSATPKNIRELISLGELDLGESRPQQLLERAPLFGDTVRWHLIGNLQRNKIRRTLPLVHQIHSVDSFRLLDGIDRIAAELKLHPRLLLEVNVSGEQAKHGFSPDELVAQAGALLSFENVDVLGLMTMAPLLDDAEPARPVFRGLRELRDRLAEKLPGLSLTELSMGMSNDFEVAIEEGATIVRVGSDLFRTLDGPHS